METTKDFYDFGIAITVTPPPDDQVYDATNQDARAFETIGGGG